MKNKTSNLDINTRESGVRFTHIKINKIVKNKAYVAEFNYGYSNMGNSHLLIGTSIHGISPQNCVEKVEKFLETKLNESEYSFHGCKYIVVLIQYICC